MIVSDSDSYHLRVYDLAESRLKINVKLENIRQYTVLCNIGEFRL